MTERMLDPAGDQPLFHDEPPDQPKRTRRESPIIAEDLFPSEDDLPLNVRRESRQIDWQELNALDPHTTDGADPRARATAGRPYAVVVIAVVLAAAAGFLSVMLIMR